MGNATREFQKIARSVGRGRRPHWQVPHSVVLARFFKLIHWKISLSEGPTIHEEEERKKNQNQHHPWKRTSSFHEIDTMLQKLSFLVLLDR